MRYTGAFTDSLAPGDYDVSDDTYAARRRDRQVSNAVLLGVAPVPPSMSSRVRDHHSVELHVSVQVDFHHYTSQRNTFSASSNPGPGRCLRNFKQHGHFLEQNLLDSEATRFTATSEC
eukprot:3925527-Amphidinium_carterae.1